jgi:hypothetical protein
MQSAWADSSADKQAIAQKLIRTEPKVKDAYWSNGSTLLVGVLDDGVIPPFPTVCKSRTVTQPWPDAA